MTSDELRQFCGEGITAQPWTDGEWSNATTGRILVRCPKLPGLRTAEEYVADAYALHTNLATKARALFDAFAPGSEWISCPLLPQQPPCSACGGTGQCMTCAGDGGVEWTFLALATGYRHHMIGDCPVCEGSGRCPECMDDLELAVTVGCASIATWALRLIATLPEAELAPRNGQSVVRFRAAGGVEGLVMAMQAEG